MLFCQKCVIPSDLAESAISDRILTNSANYVALWKFSIICLFWLILPILAELDSNTNTKIITCCFHKLINKKLLYELDRHRQDRKKFRVTLFLTLMGSKLIFSISCSYQRWKRCSYLVHTNFKTAWLIATILCQSTDGFILLINLL